MQKRRLGNTDIEVSVIALGCWPMGGDYIGGTSDAASIETIHRALELGVNFFDTAPGYGRGHSEEVLGKGLVGARQSAVISTKASGSGHSREELRRKLSASLERLQTDYVDVYFIHWPSRSEPLARAMEALEEMRSEGLIRAIGVSNFDVPMLQMASKYGRVDVLQPPYNLIWRFIEEDTLGFCREHGIGICSYSSLAQGLLTGTLDLKTRLEPHDRRVRAVLWKSENYGKCLYTVERLRPISTQLQVTLSQLALRWAVSQAGITSALVGACTPEEIAEDAGAIAFELPEATRAAIQEISDDMYYSMPYYYDMFENWKQHRRLGPQREV